MNHGWVNKRAQYKAKEGWTASQTATCSSAPWKEAHSFQAHFQVWAGCSRATWMVEPMLILLKELMLWQRCSASASPHSSRSDSSYAVWAHQPWDWTLLEGANSKTPACSTHTFGWGKGNEVSVISQMTVGKDGYHRNTRSCWIPFCLMQTLDHLQFTLGHKHIKQCTRILAVSNTFSSENWY